MQFSLPDSALILGPDYPVLLPCLCLAQYNLLPVPHLSSGAPVSPLPTLPPRPPHTLPPVPILPSTSRHVSHLSHITLASPPIKRLNHPPTTFTCLPICLAANLVAGTHWHVFAQNGRLVRQEFDRSQSVIAKRRPGASSSTCPTPLHHSFPPIPDFQLLVLSSCLASTPGPQRLFRLDHADAIAHHA
jgi:hypothetical protein